MRKPCVAVIACSCVVLGACASEGPGGKSGDQGRPQQTAAVGQGVRPAEGGSPAAASPATTPLRWNFGKGSRATYRLRDEQRAENTVEQLKQRSESDFEMLVTMEGADADASGVFPVRLVFGEVLTHDAALGLTNDAQSTPIPEGGLDSTMSAALRAMVGEEVRLGVGPTGEVTGANTDSAYQGVMARVSNIEVRSMVDRTFRSFGEERLGANLGVVMGCMPGGDRAVGDVWHSGASRASHAGAIKFDREWKLEGVGVIDGRRVATITGTCVITMPKNEGLFASMYATRLTRGEGTARVLFDVDRGVVTSARMESVMEFENVPNEGLDPYQYKPYTQAMTDVMTFTLEAWGDDAKTFTKIEKPDTLGRMR